MRLHTILTLTAALAVCLFSTTASAEQSKLRVVGTQATYAAIAAEIGGDLVTTDYIVRGDQDPHFVRPRPSLAQKLTRADLFISTGLDLELWAPSLIDMSRNKEIRSGQRRYVSASQGVRLLEVPRVKSREAGGVHIYGNPHIQTSPIAARTVAKNIAIGLSNVDPENSDTYTKNYERFCRELDRRLYGSELVKLIGSATLNRLAERPSRLIDFLQEREYQGTPLMARAGGWLRQGMPMRGRKVVAYHKNWAYFSELFGLDVRNYIEPRPGIPPSPRHVEEVVKQMRDEDIGVLIAANYYDETRVRGVAQKVGAEAVIVPLGVKGEPGVDTYFELIDLIVGRIAGAFE